MFVSEKFPSIAMFHANLMQSSIDQGGHRISSIKNHSYDRDSSSSSTFANNNYHNSVISSSAAANNCNGSHTSWMKRGSADALLKEKAGEEKTREKEETKFVKLNVGLSVRGLLALLLSLILISSLRTGYASTMESKSRDENKKPLTLTGVAVAATNENAENKNTEKTNAVVDLMTREAPERYNM